ncbi:MAG: hypothetical protein ACP5D2_03250, partial [Candidatus Nanoarchaeia archaeon]
AIFLIKGFKFVGDYAHKELLYETCLAVGLEEFYLTFLDNFRIKRNSSLYYGEQFEKTFILNNKKNIDFIIKKIEEYLNNQINNKK